MFRAPARHSACQAGTALDCGKFNHRSYYQKSGCNYELIPLT